MLSRLTYPAAFLAALLCSLTMLLAAPSAYAKVTVAQKMVSFARAELNRGVKEVPDGSNKGARIQMYGMSTTPRFYPAPWCAYFVSWVAKKAGRPIGAGGKGLGYVPYIRTWAKSTKRWRTTPRPSDLIIFPQHVGMVEKVYSNGTLTTIEGNSSNRVARRWRRWKEPMGYVRIASGGTVTKPAKAKPKPEDKEKDEKKENPTGQPLIARISVYPQDVIAVGQQAGFSANDSSGDIVKFEWDLDGDGKFDDAKTDNAERTYTRAGKFKVGLRVTGLDKKSNVAYRALTVRQNQAPAARLELPAAASVWQTVQAKAGGSKDPDGQIARYEWDTNGDGIYQSGGQQWDVSYDKPGTYVIGLRVFDNEGAMSETSKAITVTTKPPVAKANVPRDTKLGETVWLDGWQSYDPDGNLSRWAWDVDNDGNADVEGARAAWKPTQPGPQQLRLTVTDQWGAQAQTTVTVNVSNRAPAAKITVPAQVPADTPLTFDAGGSTDPDSQIARYQWDLNNDGQWDAEGVQATGTFAGDGERKIRLKATDQWGAEHITQVSFRLQHLPTAAVKLYSPAAAGSYTAFNAAGSYDADGVIKRLDWDFDADGTVDKVTWKANAVASWAYPAAGSYTAKLTVTDDDGLQHTATVPVTVR